MMKAMNMKRRIKKLEKEAKEFSENFNKKSTSRAILPPNKIHGSDKYVRNADKISVYNESRDLEDYLDWES